MTSKTILIADDDPAIRQLLGLMLSENGYTVFTAENGYQLVQMAQEVMPELLLVDLMMPHLDGYEAIRQLRNDTRTAHIPMLILTARSNPNDVVTGFETGADDYIIKPFNTSELLARIKSHLRRAAQRPVHNPLTGLAGNVLLVEEMRFRLKRDEPFAMLYIDLNNFKAFNDTYGFARGDQVLKLVADVITETVAYVGGDRNFVGHIGGDDFAVITAPESVETLCTQIIAAFDARVRDLYDPADLTRGYLEGVDRHGVTRQFPITSLSIGGVTNLYRKFESAEELGRVAAEMKGFAKTRPGSTYAIDSRGAQGSAVITERRGSSMPALLLIGSESAQRLAISAAVEAAGYRLWSAPSLVDAHAIVDRSPLPDLIIADVPLDDDLRRFCVSLLTHQPRPPVVLILPEGAAPPAEPPAGVSAFLRLPLAHSDVVETVTRLISSRDPLQ